ncbi:MAG TPA: 3'-5' exonuclease, partial [Candidatus Sumerlaeota bacterium]|nr:3'-5' exonuclease [Candidatus Sumerlaeota bacterium]
LALMTLHAAKGLEFDAVFMVGMEDPIFPNRRTVEESQSIEEERRLFYVGLTRARNRVFLSRADSRLFHGKRDWNLPSLFIDEIPENLKKAWDPRRYGWNATDRHCKKH